LYREGNGRQKTKDSPSRRFQSWRKNYVEKESEKIGKKRPPKKGPSKITKVRQ
jgi:hypothetical protein